MKNLCIILLFSSFTFVLSAQNNRWDNQFTNLNAPDDTVFTIAVDGNNVYIGGAFHNVAGNTANHIAHFDGTTWNTIGNGVNGNVYAIIHTTLYTFVGGNFSLAGGVPAENFAIWDGSTWTAPGNTCNGAVRALLAYDNYLYVGGDFTTIGGISANHIARYNGTIWEALGAGVDGPVYCIHQGTFLNVGGNFTQAGGLPANNIARWNNIDWQPIGDGFNNQVNSITGLGAQITAAGNFTQSGTNTVNYIGEWNGSQWLPYDIGTNGIIRKVEQVGTDIYASGNFTTAGIINTNNIALWNGTSWSSLGDGLNQQGFTLNHSGYDLYCGGAFTVTGLNPSNFIGRYYSPPIIIQQSGFVTKCQGDSLLLYVIASSGSAVTYQWYIDGTPTGTNNDTLLIYPAQINNQGNYICTLTNIIGNTNSNPMSVAIFQEPVFSSAQTDTSVCEGTILDLTGNPSGTMPITFQWYYNSSILTGETNDTLKFSSISSTDDGNYYCISTNVCGDDTSFFNLTTHLLPTASFSGLASEYCINDSSDVLYGIPTGGVFSGNGITDTIFNPYGLVGNHTVIYTYTDVNGCIGTSSQSTLVNALTTVTFTGLDADYCFNSLSDTLHVNPIGGIFYGSGISDSIFNPFSAGTGNQNVYYAYTDSNGCTNTISQTTLIYAPQIFSYTGLDTSLCINDNVYAIIVNPSTGIFSGTGITGSTFNPQTAGIGTHEILYQYTDLQGCVTTDSINFHVNNIPLITFTHISSDYCKNAISDTLTASPAGGNFWGTNIISEVLTPSLFAPGSYFAYYTFTDSFGCSNTDSSLFTITDAVTVIFTGITTSYCENESSDSLIGTPSGGIFSGPGVVGNAFYPSLAGTGTHPVVYTYDNLNGCFSYDSVDVTVFALPSIQIGPDTSICSGDSLTITAIGDTGILLWNNGDTTSSINVYPSVTTTYAATLYAGTCFNSDTIQIIVNPKPSIELGPDTSTCSPAIIQAQSGFASYLWSNNSTDSSITVTLSGTYSLTVTNQFNCSHNDSIVLDMLPSPQVDLGQDQTISGLQTIIIGTSPNYESYIWNTGSTQNFIVVIGSSLGEGTFPYWLTAYNLNGCSASDSILITVLGDIGVHEKTMASLFNIYPNPTQDYLYISFPENTEKPLGIIIFSSIGKKVIEIDETFLYKSVNKIDVSQLPRGSYFIQVNFKEHIGVNKFITK